MRSTVAHSSLLNRTYRCLSVTMARVMKAVDNRRRCIGTMKCEVHSTKPLNVMHNSGCIFHIRWSCSRQQDEQTVPHKPACRSVDNTHTHTPAKTRYAPLCACLLDIDNVADQRFEPCPPQQPDSMSSTTCTHQIAKTPCCFSSKTTAAEHARLL